MLRAEREVFQEKLESEAALRKLKAGGAVCSSG
jgi:hypothetical protein